MLQKLVKLIVVFYIENLRLIIQMWYFYTIIIKKHLLKDQPEDGPIIGPKCIAAIIT